METTKEKTEKNKIENTENTENNVIINENSWKAKYKNISHYPTISIKFSTEHNVFVGQSIEEKVARVTQSNQPIESISPMIYTERKEGVKAEFDIRTDKWDLAQTAMGEVANKYQKARAERQTETKTTTTETIEKQ